MSKQDIEEVFRLLATDNERTTVKPRRGGARRCDSRRSLYQVQIMRKLEFEQIQVLNQTFLTG